MELDAVTDSSVLVCAQNSLELLLLLLFSGENYPRYSLLCWHKLKCFHKLFIAGTMENNAASPVCGEDEALGTRIITEHCDQHDLWLCTMC